MYVRPCVIESMKHVPQHSLLLIRRHRFFVLFFFFFEFFTSSVLAQILVLMFGSTICIDFNTP